MTETTPPAEAGVLARTRSDDYRGRLMEGMAAAVAERGYAETTVADIVRHARVSKRTFYELFGGKEECLLALYVAASERTLEVIAEAAEGSPDLETRIARATAAYLARLEAHPVLVRTLFMEILAAGAAGLAVRREINDRFAAMLRDAVEMERRAHPERPPLSPDRAAALVGGINELILLAILDNRVDRLRELAGPVSALLRDAL